jgi:hypothetical protein
MAGEYYTAQNKLDIYNNEFQGWEACRQTEPTYFKANADAVSNCLNNLEEAQDNFWVKLSKTKTIVLFILAGLGSAISGYLAVWSVWFASLGIHRFIRWIKFCFKSKSFHISRMDKDDDIVKEVEVLEYHIEKAVEGKDKAREEELVQEVEMLKDEVCSVRADIEKLSTTADNKYDIPKNELDI